MTIFPAERMDLPAILNLQKRAFASEAELLNNPNIAPLRQTLAELEEEFGRLCILKAVDEDGALVGSVRVRLENSVAHVGKLIVEPAQQGQGLGTRLLAAAEAHCPAARYALFTSAKSERNLRLYEKAGYREVRREQTPDGVPMVFLEKAGG